MMSVKFSPLIVFVILLFSACSENKRYQLEVDGSRELQYILDTQTGDIRILNLVYGDTNVYHCDYQYSTNLMSPEYKNGKLVH